ncbi:MAG: PQQ-dependent sugar dehydrogenase [Sphingobacteriales bacterium]|nr:MAG: PQQ-dependent sugar dehydrogenase [Sphingobacteriales bacterium]
MRAIFTCIVVLFLFTTCKKNKSDGNDTGNLPDVELKNRVVVSGLRFPWGMVYGPDNFIWFTERGGKISRLNPANGQISPLLTISEVRENGEGGLLGIALNPDFSTNPWVYVAYNYGSSYKEKIVRYTYTGGALTNPLAILDNIGAASNHNGSRLLIFGGKLFISTGDAADTNTPQNVNSTSGKILRVNLDGSIPADNPYPNNRLWTFGHRNPQGLVQVGNKVFSSEHGPDSDDEINVIEKGRNYGWPNIKGFCDEAGEQSFCSANSIAQPLIVWTPTIAPSGMAYYTSDYIPQFKNSLLLAVLKNTKLMQLKLDDGQTKIEGTKDFFVNSYGRMRDVCISPEGKIYVCTSNGNDDKIIEIYK